MDTLQQMLTRKALAIAASSTRAGVRVPLGLRVTGRISTARAARLLLARRHRHRRSKLLQKYRARTRHTTTLTHAIQSRITPASGRLHRLKRPHIQSTARGLRVAAPTNANAASTAAVPSAHGNTRTEGQTTVPRGTDKLLLRLRCLLLEVRVCRLLLVLLVNRNLLRLC